MSGVDVTPFMVSNSDQLNADDLRGGPITVKIIGVKETGQGVGKGKQPMSIRISGGHMPVRPCKTMIRLLFCCWGPTLNGEWVGRWMTLYRDGSVNSPDGTKNAGGVRISDVSHIDRPQTHMLPSTRGKKKPWRVGVINRDNQQNSGAPTADMDKFLTDENLTRADVDRWRARQKDPRPPLSELKPEQVAQLAGWLAGDKSRLEPIRALIPAEATS